MESPIRHRSFRWLFALLVLAAAPPPSSFASAIPDWNFLDDLVPSWQAAGDIGALSRMPDGMVVVPSGPAPTLVAPAVAFTSAEAVYVRFRVRSPKAIDGAYLGWSSVDPSGRETNSGVTFTIPRQLRGGFVRTVWVRVADSPDWSGEIHRLGLALPLGEDGSDEPITIGSIGVFAPTVLTRLRVAWAALELDATADDMAVPIRSLNAIRSVRLDHGTPYGYAGIVAIIGVLTIGAAGWIRRARLSRLVGHAGLVVLIVVIIVLSALDVYLEVSAWRIERAVFGGTTSAQDYTYLDGLDLVGVANDLNQTLPPGTSVAVCFFGDGAMRHIVSNRVRYQFYPIYVRSKARYLLVFAQHQETCGVSRDDLLIERPLYALYRSR